MDKVEGVCPHFELAELNQFENNARSKRPSASYVVMLQSNEANKQTLLLMIGPGTTKAALQQSV